MRVSVSTSGVQANQQSIGVGVSESGRFVVFESFASNLVPGDGNADSDIFLHDRDTDEDGVFDEPAARSTIRLTRPGVDPNGQSFIVRITPDGRYVAFTSSATNMIAPPATAQVGARNVFRYDRLTVRSADRRQPGTTPASRCSGLFCSEPSISDRRALRGCFGAAFNLDRRPNSPSSCATSWLERHTRLSPPQPTDVCQSRPPRIGAFRAARRRSRVWQTLVRFRNRDPYRRASSGRSTTAR